LKFEAKMKIKLRRNALVSLIIAIFILPFIGRAEEQKVKVVVEKASIRLEPSMESEIIASPDVGTVYDVEKKVGEWYEIKFYSKIGVLITGYIHQMFVEKVSEEAAPKPKVPQKPEKHEPTAGPKEIVAQKRPIINLKLSLMSYSVNGYDYHYRFPFRGEFFTTRDSIEKESLLGFDIGVGYFVKRNLELEGGLSLLATHLPGLYVISVPSPFVLNDPASAEFNTHASVNELILSFGASFHPFLRSQLKPYFGAGGVYIDGRWDLMTAISYREMVNGATRTHSVVIDDVSFAKTDVSKFGFFGKLGLEVTISRTTAFFSELRFLSAKENVSHPAISILGSTYVPTEMAEIGLGGISLILGIRIFFSLR
jgi:hypothetical protein